MDQKQYIPMALAETVIQMIMERTTLEKQDITTEFQDDFQFLLITIPSEQIPAQSQDERKQLGYAFDRLMPKRAGELTWMLNFTLNGSVVDSYFGGDSTVPELGF